MDLFHPLFEPPCVFPEEYRGFFNWSCHAFLLSVLFHTAKIAIYFCPTMSKNEYFIYNVRFTPPCFLSPSKRNGDFLPPTGIYFHSARGLPCGEEMPGDSGEVPAFVGDFHARHGSYHLARAAVRHLHSDRHE